MWKKDLRRMNMCAPALLFVPGLLVLFALPCRAGSLWDSYSPALSAPKTPPVFQVQPAPKSTDASSIFNSSDPETGDTIMRVTPRPPTYDTPRQNPSLPLYPPAYPYYGPWRPLGPEPYGPCPKPPPAWQPDQSWRPPFVYQPGLPSSIPRTQPGRPQYK